MLDHGRKGQKWITEEFYKVLDVYGFRAVMFVEWGFRPADVKRTTEIRLTGAKSRSLSYGSLRRLGLSAKVSVATPSV